MIPRSVSKCWPLKKCKSFAESLGLVSFTVILSALFHIYNCIHIFYTYLAVKQGRSNLDAQDQRLPMNQCWLNQLIANPATFNLAVNHVAVPSEIANESALVS